MLRKTAFILLALALVAGVPALAIAQSEGPQHHGHGSGHGDQNRDGDCQCDRDCLSDRIDGVILSIDAENLALEMDTDEGCIFVQLTEKTRIKMGPDPATFEDLKVGQTISVCGVLDEDEGVMAAKLINIKYKGEIK